MNFSVTSSPCLDKKIRSEFHVISFVPTTMSCDLWGGGGGPFLCDKREVKFYVIRTATDKCRTYHKTIAVACVSKSKLVNKRGSIIFN